MGGVDVGGGGRRQAKSARLGHQHDPVHRPADVHHRVPPHHGGVGDQSRINADAQVPGPPDRRRSWTRPRRRR